MTLDWGTIILTFGFGLIGLILLATLVTAIVQAMRRRGQAMPATESEETDGGAYRAYRETLEESQRRAHAGLGDNYNGVHLPSLTGQG